MCELDYCLVEFYGIPKLTEMILELKILYIVNMIIFANAWANSNTLIIKFVVNACMGNLS